MKKMKSGRRPMLGRENWARNSIKVDDETKQMVNAVSENRNISIGDSVKTAMRLLMKKERIRL